jgi:hypothetical protein
MRTLKILYCFILLLLGDASMVFGQRDAKITKVEIAPKLDGYGTDNCWNNLPIHNNFTQIQPDPEKPSKYETKVRLCYDNTAIYIFAEMLQPSNVTLKQLGERDAIGRVNADVFQIFFDTYNDNQNGFAFKVTAAGVQGDDKMLNGGGDNGGSDNSWDAVWESKTRTDNEGWYAEIKIPFSAIRFPKTDVQTWGFNMQRRVRKFNETSFYSPIDVNKSGFLAQFGNLTGLKEIKPPVRLALFPYINLGTQKLPGDASTYPASGGMDIKYGINDAFTLDMTLVPDFNQVASDNLIRNTSPFEQQLAENRPFFTEGVELFNRQGMLYTRRIGSTPTGFYALQDKYADTAKYDITKNPSIARLYNAFKISGRTSKKLGVGIFNALQAPAKASILDKNSNLNFKEKTQDLINYNMIVLDQALKGQSYINFSNTNTLRRDNSRHANVSGLQYVQFSKNENYSMNASINMSTIFEAGKINTGFFTSLNLSKSAGKLKYGIENVTYGKKFDQTDLGIQFDYNHAEQSAGISYDNNTPKNKRFQSRGVGFRVKSFENMYPFKLKQLKFEANSFYLFKNFVDVNLEMETSPFGQNNFYSLASRGINFHTFGYTYVGAGGSSDSRKKLYSEFYYGHGFQHNNPTYTYDNARLLVRYLFNDHFNLNAVYAPTFDNSNVDNTYITLPGDKPLLAFRHILEQVLEFNAKYTFSPNANLNARFRHYNAKITNKKLYTITQDGDYLNNQLPYTNAYDENFNLQNIDIFYNWIFRPGSRLVCSYKQWLNDAYILNSELQNSFGRNVNTIIKAPKAYAISVRLIWYLDYNQVKKQ